MSPSLRPRSGLLLGADRLSRQGEGALGGRKPPLDPSCGEQRQWGWDPAARERSVGWSKGQAGAGTEAHGDANTGVAV